MTETGQKVAVITGGSQGTGAGHMGQVSDIIFLAPPFITGRYAAKGTGQAPGSLLSADCS